MLRTMIQSVRTSTSSTLEELNGGMRRQKDRRSSLLSMPLATLRYQLSISKRTTIKPSGLLCPSLSRNFRILSFRGFPPRPKSTMPPVRTSRNRKPPPDGFDEIEDTLLEFSNKMKDAENASHDGKKKHEMLWPIFQISHQRVPALLSFARQLCLLTSFVSYRFEIYL